MNVPILLLLYKRPETTIQVIKALKKVKPKIIYLSINLPPVDTNLKDFENYNKVLNLVKKINWKCKLKIKKRKKHLKSYDSYKSSINWFFKNEKEGIILEDDTVPNKSFFVFCSKLLKKYRNNQRVTQICGSSFLNQNKIQDESYIFSNYSLGWGYATWRRSIKDYDEKMKDWPTIRKKKLLLKIINNKYFLSYWTKVFDNQYKNKFQAFDERWLFSNWKNNKLSIIPKKHLVKNIGFGKSATHTKIKHWYANLETNELKYLDKHPKHIYPNIEYDDWLNTNVYGVKFNYIKLKILKNRFLNNKTIFKIIRLIFKLIKPFFRIIKPTY